MIANIEKKSLAYLKNSYQFILNNQLCYFNYRYVKDATLLQNLAQNMEELIFNVADMTFFFNDLEDCDQVDLIGYFQFYIS